MKLLLNLNLPQSSVIQFCGSMEFDCFYIRRCQIWCSVQVSNFLKNHFLQQMVVVRTHKKFEMRVHLKGHLIMWYDFDRGVRYKTTPITTSKTFPPLKFFLLYLYFTHNFYEIQEIFYLIRLTRRHLTTNAISLNFVQWKYDKNVCIFLCIFNEANITQTGRLYYSFQSVNAKERNIFSVITRHCLWSKITFFLSIT